MTTIKIAIFIGSLWLLIPFIIVMLGIVVSHLFAAELGVKRDAACPTHNKQSLFAGVLAAPAFEMHFLNQVPCCFGILFAIEAAMSRLAPLPGPRKLPAREDIALATEPIIKIAAAAAAMFLIFH